MHTPFAVSELISPEDLRTDPITAILLHGELCGLLELDLTHARTAAANRIILGTEKGALLVFDLSNLANNGAFSSLAGRVDS